jgi:hypothetical protein
MYVFKEDVALFPIDMQTWFWELGTGVARVCYHCRLDPGDATNEGADYLPTIQQLLAKRGPYRFNVTQSLHPWVERVRLKEV